MRRGSRVKVVARYHPDGRTLESYYGHVGEVVGFEAGRLVVLFDTGFTRVYSQRELRAVRRGHGGEEEQSG